MFDKLLCKHIQKKTITLFDVVLFIGHYCMCGALLLCIFPMAGVLYCGIYNVVLFNEIHTISLSIASILNYTIIGFFVSLIIVIGSSALVKVLKIEVAHCPVKDENGGIEK